MSESTHPTDGGRKIGVTHRVKATVDGESRPTIVVIRNPDGHTYRIELNNEQEELDFVLGQFPVKYRKIEPEDDPLKFRSWHLKRASKAKKAEVTHVPTDFDGLRAKDTVVLMFGGSGDYLAYGISTQAEVVGAAVKRIAPFKLAEVRGERSKDDDASLLVETYCVQPDLFSSVRPRDKAITLARVTVRQFLEVQRERIAAGNRFRQAFYGRAFTLANLDPSIDITEACNRAEKEDAGMCKLEADEKSALAAVTSALRGCDVYQALFDPIEGVGPSIGGRILTAISDVSRFKNKYKLRMFCGVAVGNDGKFLRRRKGQNSNWNPQARQGLWLLGDQMNRRPYSVWGRRLTANLEKLRTKHPHPVVVVSSGDHKIEYSLDGVVARRVGTGSNYELFVGADTWVKISGITRYGPLHLRKQALWRTLTDFSDWVFYQWWNIEKGKPVVEADVWFQTIEAAPPSVAE